MRKLLGYRRFEGLAAARAITRFYGASRLFVNFFQPSFKLASKHRDGAKVTKRYHPPQTPCERLLQTDSIPMVAKSKLREISANLDPPLKLLEEMRAVQAYLAALADGDSTPPMISEPPNLAAFVASLSSAWRKGEIRPTFSAGCQTAIPARSGKEFPRKRASPLPQRQFQCHHPRHRTSAAQEVATRLRRAWPSPCPGTPHGMADRLPATESLPNINASQLFDELCIQFPRAASPRGNTRLSCTASTCGVEMHARAASSSVQNVPPAQ